MKNFQKSVPSLRSGLANRRGVTLMELLVAMGLAAGTLLLMASILVETTTLSKGFEARAHDEVERMTAERQLRSVFTQAVDLNNFGDNDLNNFTGAVNFSGAIREYDSDPEWNTPPSTRTLAIFYREAELSPTPAAASPYPGPVPSVLNKTQKYVKTGIFFQKPTIKTWGVLYIDLGDGATLAPDRSDLLFEGLTAVRIKNVKTFSLAGTAPVVATLASAPAAVSSFDIEMTFRKFINPKGAGFVFCPRKQMGSPSYPDCVDASPSRDISRTLRIVVKNNVLTISPAAPLSATPDISTGSTTYDRIHFFKPYTASGML